MLLLVPIALSQDLNSSINSANDIVDGLLSSPPSASLGGFPTSRRMRQVKPKLVEANDDYMKLDTCDVVNNGFTRVGRGGYESELVPLYLEPENGEG